MHKDDLFKLLETEEVKNNPELHKELHTLWEESNISISARDIEGLSIDAYISLLGSDLNPSVALEAALILEPGEKRDQLIELALTKKIDWHNFSTSNLPSLTIMEAEKLLDKGLKPDVILEKTLEDLRKGYEPESEEYNSASLSDNQKELLELAIEKGADINKVFTESFDGISRIVSNDGLMLPHIIPVNILKILVQDYSLDPKIILQYSANNGLKELLDFVLDNFSDLEITLEDYIEYLFKFSFEETIRIIKTFPNIFDREEFYEYGRSLGASDMVCKSVIDIHDLMLDYIGNKKGQNTSLSTDEIQILNGKYIIDDIESYNKIELINNYGYTPLHLALIADRYDIAVKMVELGADIYAKANNNITILHLLDGDDEDESHFIQLLSKFINQVDVDLGNGQSLADVLIKNQNLQDEVIEKSNDPLYSLFKEEVDLFLPSQDSSKTSIAISHGDGFWSDGLWSTSRLLVSNHPDVQFYLVKDDMVERGGEDFIKQFDAVINPGAGDSFPKIEEFSKEDCSFDMPLEQHYQNMLNQTEQFHIPYLGMCAGAQHLSLYHGGKLKTVEGYNKGQHNMTFIKGTLSHFLSLNKDQQEKALSSCEFPEVTFKGDTAHHYAAVNDNLGGEMQLGAVSEDGVAMAYMHSNIRFATQYHPEHHYSNSSEINHQALWLDHFVDMAIMHHDYRVNSGVHPMEYYANVQEKLSGCISMQEDVVLNDGDISSL